MNKSKQNLSILNLTLSSGGTEKVISLLLKKLILDYNVTLVLCYNVVHFPIPKEVNVIFLSKKSWKKPKLLKFIDWILFIFKYNRFLKKESINISISFLAFPNLINGFISNLNKSVKVIISERGFPSKNVTSKLSLYISKVFYPLIYNRCDKLFTNSVHIEKDLINNFGIKIPIEVIYNPIEIPKSALCSNYSDKNIQTFQIITVGSLNTNKNHIMILKALTEIKNDNKLTILGEGHLRNYLELEIKNRSLKNKVILKGKVKNVNEYLLNSNCFVLSSFTEGFPNALMEAMAIGIPCISTNCLSGPLELLNENEEIKIINGEFFKGKYGLLVNIDDHIGLSKAIDFFRNNPSEREKYSVLSLLKAKEYELDNIYSKFKYFIQN